ncbi:MAG: hypothetical protein M1834_006595 [Cirrosporium novae-zelandiae]|nr:MAG: hypothetical protein M1834_006595 [Cirrosporium novae-zelandiae]
MRNLKCVSRLVATCLDELPLTGTAWDSDTDSLLCTYGPTEELAVIELRRFEGVGSEISESGLPLKDSSVLLASWDAPCPLPDLKCDHILSFQYFPDNRSACLVLEGGDLVVVREEPQLGEEQIEIVGSVDAGLTAAAWSPDGELLTITTRANTLLYMTRTFDNVNDISFNSDDLKISKHVSVGWGKSETQFKGKRAHALRDPTMPEKVDAGVLSELDSGKTTISWRGDGAYVAMNSIESGTRRVIRVYSRDGVLDSVSEPVDGLDSALSWRPAGNIIAGIQRLENRIDVVFFERNGLRHGQFTLRINKEDVKMFTSKIELQWNADSTVLAVCFLDSVQLWTMGNYHYYLKGEVMLQSGLVGGPDIRWHPEKPLHFTINSGDILQRLEYIFDICRGPIYPPHDTGSIAVIDGQTVKFSPLRLANVPPPMALHELEVSANSLDVAFNQDGTKLVVLHHSSLSIYGINYDAKPIPAPVLHRSVELTSSSSKIHNQQVCVLEDELIYVLQSHSEGQNILEISPGATEAKTIYTIPLTDRISRICPDNSFKRAFCLKQQANGSVTNWMDIKLAGQPISEASMLAQNPETPWVELVENPGHTYAFGLSANGALYYRGTPIVKGVTSFLATSSHLIFTTSQHLVKFVHLSKTESPQGESSLEQDLEIPPDAPETDERCRSIERGARLVTVMPSSFALVFQMPRGNLETIYPRALVLPGIRESIIAKDYRKAFLACRNHRVDMNLLYDYAPEQFLFHTVLFVNQLKKVEHIDLFLSHLKEEDVSQTLYKETLPSRRHDPNGIVKQSNGESKLSPPSTKLETPKSKVNTICDAIIEVLKTRLNTNLQNVITAHVCKSPPDYDSGLLLVKKLGTESTALATKAIEHICFLVDVNRLYDNALGLYDLELALLVAQQSQKDPKEYMPFLQNLEAQPLLRRKFSIDDHLGRHTKALEHLHSLDVFNEFSAYVEKHTLYSFGLSLLRYQQEKFNKIMQQYADHLYTNSKFKEAGIAYESLSLYQKATDSYRQSLDWSACLTTASLISLPETALTNLATTLAATLAESHDYLSAAEIHLTHLHDIPAAARLYCKATHFSHAARLLSLHDPTLLPQILDPGLTSALASTIDMLAEMKSQLHAQVPRIHELRIKKATDPLAFFEGTALAGEGPDNNIPDNISLASTNATSAMNPTLMTRYTGHATNSTLHTNTTRRSSKSRRREERKRARGKKGSVYEEEYLVSSVRRLVERVNGVLEEVERLVEGLVRRAMWERARNLEGLVTEVCGLCGWAVGEVWPEEEVGIGEKGGVERGEGMGMGIENPRPAGADGVVWDSLEEMRGPGKAPVVGTFKKFDLL